MASCLVLKLRHYKKKQKKNSITYFTHTYFKNIYAMQLKVLFKFMSMVAYLLHNIFTYKSKCKKCFVKNTNIK